MYIKKINVKNYGPIESLEYTFPINEDNNPTPVVLLGLNGAGKTLLLANIVHSIIEMKRRKYEKIPEVSGTLYYRSGTTGYIRNGANEAYEQFVFTDDAKYTELFTHNYQKLVEKDPPEYPEVNLNDRRFAQTGYYINTIPPKTNVFESQIFLFFPVDRYYIPTWENVENEKADRIVENSHFVGISDSEVIKYNVLEGISDWLLNVILEKELYERRFVFDEEEQLPKLIYQGKNTNILQAVARILKLIFQDDTELQPMLSVSKKTRLDRKLQILKTDIEGHTIDVVSQLTNLSSGEAMLLGIMTQILREYDRISDKEFSSFDEVEGIVMIDEADVHLHSNLLRNTLPELVKLFPKIQFVFSTHSPLLLLGMKESFGDGCQFLHLPAGLVNNNIEAFSEVDNYFSAMDNTYQEILGKLNNAIEKINGMNKPLIITEGKTDWKHFKSALRTLQREGKYTELDVEFLEYEQQMGDAKLEILLQNLNRLPQNKMIIGVFDSDTSIGKKYINRIDLGNNVFGVCISDFWGYGTDVSVEMLYKRDDLRKKDETGRRIFLSDEFNLKTGRMIEDKDIITQNNTIREANKNGTIKVIDSEVYDSDEKSIALSKGKFAEMVLNSESPYDSMDVSGFEGIFNAINEIVNGKGNS